jgi:iron complex outermembrane receptor protein
VQYTQPVGSAGDLVFNVDYRYQDKMYSAPHNRPTDTIPSYDLWNARVAYMTSSDRWSVAAWIRNIGDEEYIINRNTASITNIDRVVWGTPRLYGVNFTYNLGE